MAQGDPPSLSPLMRIDPSTPVRTGRPLNQGGGSSHPAFDPCSHRETRRRLRLLRQVSLRPPFAQGDRPPLSVTSSGEPSTPVRTWRPGSAPTRSAIRSFDPCSHRETVSRDGGRHGIALRPLFAQGGLRIRVGTSMIRLQSMRAGGFQAKARDARILTSSPAVTGQTPSRR